MPLTWNAPLVVTGLSVVQPARPRLLRLLKETIDARHGLVQQTGRAMTAEHFDVVGGDWLDRLMHTAYGGWRAAQEGLPAPAAAPIPVMFTSAEFDDCAWNDGRLHKWIHWAAHELTHGHPIDYRWVFEPVPARSPLHRPAGLRKRVVGEVGDRRAPVMITDPYFRCEQAEWAAAMWKLRSLTRWDDLGYPLMAPGELDPTWRLARAQAVTPVSSFEDFAAALLPLLMPIVLLEGHAALRRAMLELPIARPRVVYTANALQGLMPFKFLAAEWRDDGTLITCHQHGGGYGVDRVHTLEEYESGVSDFFYTWGWTTGRPGVRPMSPPPLPKITGRSPHARQALLCCVQFPQHFYRLHFHPMPGTIETMHRDTLECAELMQQGAMNLVVRPYPDDYGWGFVEQLRQRVPNVRCDTSPGKAYRLYRDSRIVVHNYLGTSWLETLALDVPTVCFYDPNTYAFRPAAQPIMDALEKVGILHRSGRAAADFVNALGASSGHDSGIESWWTGADVRAAREAVVDRFARFSADWVDEWAAEFGSLC